MSTLTMLLILAGALAFVALLVFGIVKGVSGASRPLYADYTFECNKTLRALAEVSGLTYRQSLAGEDQGFGYVCGLRGGYELLVWIRARTGMQGTVHTAFRVWHDGLGQNLRPCYLRRRPGRSRPDPLAATRRCFASSESAAPVADLDSEAAEALLALARDASAVVIEGRHVDVVPMSTRRPSLMLQPALLDEPETIVAWIDRIASVMKTLGIAPSAPDAPADATAPDAGQQPGDVVVATYVSSLTGGVYSLDEDRFHFVRPMTLAGWIVAAGMLGACAAGMVECVIDKLAR